MHQKNVSNFLTNNLTAISLLSSWTLLRSWSMKREKICR